MKWPPWQVIFRYHLILSPCNQHRIQHIITTTGHLATSQYKSTCPEWPLKYLMRFMYLWNRVESIRPNTSGLHGLALWNAGWLRGPLGPSSDLKALEARQHFRLTAGERGWTIASIWNKGCNYSSMPECQWRLNQAIIKVRSVITSYGELLDVIINSCHNLR